MADPLFPAARAGATDNLSLDQSRQYGRKPTMKQAGQAFEALFMQTIMKSMREAQLDEGLLNNDAEKPFIAMLDQAYSDLSVKNMRLGIAEAIDRQFTPKTPTKIGAQAPVDRVPKAQTND